MRKNRTALPLEADERYPAADNRRRGQIVSAILLLWIIASLVTDVLYYVPRGERYYLYLDLIAFLHIAWFAVLVWKYAGSARRTRTAIFFFSLLILVWAAVLATFQETPYTLFIFAFFVSTSLLIPPKDSVAVFGSAFVAYAVALTLRTGSPLADGATLFIEILALTVTAGIVSVLLYRQRVQLLHAEMQLRDTNRNQEREIAQRTEDLDRRLREREVLLREIHHRVKNNLQILASLLRLSKEYQGTKDAEALIRGAEQRVVTMAMVHKQLDNTHTFERVDLGIYLKDLSDYVIDFHRSGSTVSFSRDLQSIPVPLDTAVNLGLLTTEVLSNALQHAFEQEQSDRNVSLTVEAHDSRLVLVVRDDGKGINPEYTENGTREGLGLVLIDSLTTQLGGKGTYERSGGTTFRFEMPLPMEGLSENAPVEARYRE